MDLTPGVRKQMMVYPKNRNLQNSHLLEMKKIGKFKSSSLK
jgi:hypothetical protein